MNLGLILRFSCCALLLGRGVQAIIGDLPFRTVLWNQGLFEPVVTGIFGIPWEQYASSLAFDAFINALATGIGLFFVFVGLWAAFNIKTEKLPYFLKVTCLFLGLIFFLKFMAKSFYLAMAIEHGAQFMAPLVYAWWLKDRSLKPHQILWVKIAVSCTFIGHALFAVGFHPVPGPFIDMIINVLGVKQETAIELLFIAGSLDIACALFIYFPPLDRYALLFMVGWGLATASARVLAHVEIEQFWYSWEQWGVEMIYRLPHGLLPLAIFGLRKRV